MKCTTCENVEALYGTSESVAPWLCNCEKPEELNKQMKICEVKPRRKFGRLLVPKISAEMRRRWLRAQK